MSLAPFVPSSMIVVRKMLEMADIKPGELLYDLGCGDARILIIAVKEFKAKAIGVELREDLFRKATEEVKKLSLESDIKIIHGDMIQVDLSSADVITLCLLTSANEKIRTKLEKELKIELLKLEQEDNDQF